MKKYTNGDAIRNQDGKFLGYFVENLTDPIFLDIKNPEKQIGFIQNSDGTKTPVYDNRKVWHKRFGTVEQIKIKFLDGSFVWINTARDAKFVYER